MKVIIIKKCKLGDINDIVNVKDGYAINYLFPNKICKKATSKNIEVVNKINEKNKIINAKIIKKLHEMKDKILKEKITFDINYDVKTKKAAKSITNHDIEEKINKILPDLETKKFISEKHVIKTIGEHTINLKFGHNVNFSIKVLVK